MPSLNVRLRESALFARIFFPKNLTGFGGRKNPMFLKFRLRLLNLSGWLCASWKFPLPIRKSFLRVDFNDSRAGWCSINLPTKTCFTPLRHTRSPNSRSPLEINPASKRPILLNTDFLTAIQPAPAKWLSFIYVSTGKPVNLLYSPTSDPLPVWILMLQPTYPTSSSSNLVETTESQSRSAHMSASIKARISPRDDEIPRFRAA